MKPSRFRVRGSYPFPLDMLRYDSCYPASEGDSALLREAVEGGDVLTVVEIELQTDRPDVSPSDRWRSHCWAVIQEEVCR